MKRVIFVLVFLLVSSSLTGCGYLTGRTETMIQDYNVSVEETKIMYGKVEKLADASKEELYDYLFGKSKDFKDITFEDNLDIDMSDFDDSDVIKDAYFTALGATCIREIIVLSSDTKVYIEVIWGTDGVVSMTRRVV